ncbi:MAG: chemotaxis protein CheX [Thermodesulfobacteriota bacterium]
MHEEIRGAVVAAALNIFETMFFIFLDPLESGSMTGPPVMATTDPPPESSASDSWIIKSEISFSGMPSGRLLILFPYDLGQLMTKNFLGFEDEVNEAQIFDMGSELSNMVCGNVFSLLDKKSVFSLGSPKTEKVPFEEKGKYIHPEDLVLDFSTEGNPVTIVVQLVQVQSS